ncbi:hypothetical protein ACLB2K_053351 [Fragaria x ananassa]
MVPSPQVPTRESRGDGGDVLRTGWREEKFCCSGDPRLVGDCREVASQSALGWGLWLCGESVRAWLGTVARWPVSPCLVGDCGYVASQSALGWRLSRGGQSVRAWLGTVAMWRVSPRLVGDCREVANQSTLGWGLWLCGESALGWGLSRGRHQRTLSFGSETNAGLLRTVVPSSVMTKFAVEVDADGIGDGADNEERGTAIAAVVGTLSGGEEEI